MTTSIGSASIDSLCLNVTSGGTPYRQNEEFWANGTIPWVKTGELKDCYIYDAKEKITEAGLLSSSAKVFPINTILMAMYGDGKTITSLGIVKNEVATNQACCAMITNPDKCDYRYLYYALMYHRNRLLGLVIAGAQRNLSIGIIKRFKISIFPLQTQQKIASILSAYDDLIENNQRRIQLLEQAARLLYKEWFVHLRFPGHEHVKTVDGVPEGWEIGTVADFFDTTSGGTPSRKRSEFFEGDINWVKTQELNEDFIFETGEKITTEALSKSSAKLFPSETLLVSIYGGTNIGRTAILAMPSASNQACVALFPRHPSSNFIFAQLFFQINRESLIGIAQGAAQTNISQQTLRKVSMVMPSKALMQNFLVTLAPIYDQLKNLKLQNMRLEESKDILLPRLMNGELTL